MAASSAAAAIAAAVVVLVVPVTSSAQTETPTPCVQDLGTLDSATSYVSDSGIIDQDASCVSPQRDPDEPSAVYFARRHTFTLEAASSVWFGSGGSAANSLLIEGASSDGTGVVLARDGAFYLVLEAGTYTIEATTARPGDVGSYSVWVRRFDRTPCVQDLGTLDAATASARVSGLIDQDASCTSPQRDPDSSDVYFARRHTFTLGAVSSVSFSLSWPSDPGTVHLLLIEGASSDGSGVVLARGESQHLVLGAGTYTIEATTARPGAVGGYRALVRRFDRTPCVQDLGALASVVASASVAGIIDQDASCVSPQRDPDDRSAVYFARRHTFMLDASSSVSFSSNGLAPRLLLIKGASSDGTGLVLARGGTSHLVLEAGTYTIEATTASPGDAGSYTVSVNRYGRTPCVQDLGTLDSMRTTLWAPGVIDQDASCTSPQRDPGSSDVYLARRHTFTLDTASLVSFGHDSSSVQVATRSLLIEGASSDGSGAVLARDGASNLVLGVGTYTVEATTAHPGDVGIYAVWVSRSPVIRDVTVTAASAREGDGAVVFTLEAARPGGIRPADVVAPLSVRWAAVSGSAVAGADFEHASGTVSIPSDGRRATVAVPLVADSTAESTETLTLRLSSPQDAALDNMEAIATIVDDDPEPADPTAAVAVCDGAVVRGGVADVFDVEQSGFSQWHHVFVDVDVSCGGDLNSAVGYPTAVSVIDGPAASLGSSRHCLTGDGTRQVTASVAAAAGCRTFASPSPAKFTRDGRSTHILWVPDTAVGIDHGLRAWVDLDRDGAHDGGEPYRDFASDFASRTLSESGFYDYAFPEDFTVDVAEGSTRAGRGGHYSILVLRFSHLAERMDAGHVEPPATTDPALVNMPVGVSISAGPSRGQEVFCVNASGSGNAPASAGPGRTSDTGHLAVFYQVPLDAVDAHSVQQDVLRVHFDRDHDGMLDQSYTSTGIPYDAEPSRRLYLPIAKAANYIALGDSYSAGENGDTPEPGSYQSGIGDADDECRRWNLAYPYIFNRDFLKTPELDIDVTFKTFACTGAITLNIYDPADPDGTPPPAEAHETDRPSPKAEFGRPVYRPARPGADRKLLHERHPRWEPRQGASLAGVETMRDVDMVTLTIGGNDAGFSNRIENCARVNECDPAVSVARLTEIEQMVVDVLARVKQVAPDAAVFVLGYPYLTPEVDPCGNPQEIRQPPRSGSQSIELDFSGLPDGCGALWDMYFDAVDTCDTLSATGVFRGSYFYLAAALHPLVGSDRTRIDYREAKAMWSVAGDLNARLRSAARRARVHFVDVVGGVPLEDAPRGFVGHSSCNREDPWMNGFVVKSGRGPAKEGFDGSAFHPTAAGQAAYALLLEEYIRVQIEAGAELNSAGLPVAPVPVGDADSRVSAQQSVPGPSRSADSSGAVGARRAKDSGSSQQRSSVQPVASVGLLVARPATDVSGCGAPFVSPGEQVTLSAAGFAADAAVSFAARAMSLGSTQLTAPQIVAATADSDGAIAVAWTVPTAPDATVDTAPRAYIIDASGLNAGGGTHSARMGLPLVAYPATAPCAKADAAATTLGRVVTVAVLANDVAPTGGSLDAASVQVRAARGGSFAVDSTTGAVTFTPDAGFWGTVETSYVVYDSWGIGTEAALTITVDAGCTVTGTADVVRIEGTDGDDVICVPDPDDRRAFHVIDAKGGNDIILGGAGVDLIYAGGGTDAVYAGGSSDHIDAGAGSDVVYGGSGLDTVYSTDLADTVHDDPGGSELVVEPAATVEHAGPVTSADWHYVDVSQAAVIDVLGNDYDPNGDLDPATLRIVRQPSSGAARVSLSADGNAAVVYTATGEGGTGSFAYEVCDRLAACSTAEVTVMAGTAHCTIVGTEAADTLRGTPGHDVICGLGGDDAIRGIGGDDTIVGGAGNDTIDGGDGDDLIWGGSGDDMLTGGAGADAVWGGSGGDSLAGNGDQDELHGGDGDDTAVGGGEDDAIWGGQGDDNLDGHAGSDSVHGGPGDDGLRGGNGDDTLWGGAGRDTLTGGAGDDTLHGGTGDDVLDGNTQNDTLWGGPGNDTLDGQGHDDQLHGGAGNDTLRGGAAGDRVHGGSGDDDLDGGDGADYLNAGPGTDACTRGETTTGCENEARGQ